MKSLIVSFFILMALIMPITTYAQINNQTLIQQLLQQITELQQLLIQLLQQKKIDNETVIKQYKYYQNQDLGFKFSYLRNYSILELENDSVQILNNGKKIAQFNVVEYSNSLNEYIEQGKKNKIFKNIKQIIFNGKEAYEGVDQGIIESHLLVVKYKEKIVRATFYFNNSKPTSLTNDQQKILNSFEFITINKTDMSPISIIEHYYESINTKDFYTASDVWSNKAQCCLEITSLPGLFESDHKEFIIFNELKQINLISTGKVLNDVAAGSQYATVPVLLEIILQNGNKVRVEGNYILRRSNLSESNNKPWVIHSADLNLVKI